jgi:molybdate transport system substrate-binding protein
MLAAGKVELGFQQLSELLNVEGVAIVGPLPPELQLLTQFSAAVATSSGEPKAAGEFLKYMMSAPTAAVKARFGMEA